MERRHSDRLSRAIEPSRSQGELVHELFEEQVQRAPGALAVVYGEHSLTYAELNAKSNQLARYLRERHIGPDQLVGICVERSLDMIIGLLGILKAGGAYMPLDPSYPPERLRYMLADAAPRVVLTQGHLRDHFPSSDADVIALDEQWSEINLQLSDVLNAASLGLRSDHLAYVIYTSGSTGNPKGVMIEHRHILNLWQGLESAYRQSAPCQRIALNASLNFDASVQQFVQLLSGRTLCVIPEVYRRDASILLRFFSESQIHGVDCTPSQLRAWISLGFLEANRFSVRMVLVGGEAIDNELWDTLAGCSGTDFYNVYGPTECTVDSTIASLKGDTTAPHIGHPMENREVYVLDGDQHPITIGVTGEIYIGGAGIGRGYLNRPEMTAERFITDPFSADPPARMYKTGDLGRWRADGNIEYLGRNDDQVKIRGFRIELGEIETRLLQHPQVKEAVVLAREDQPGEKRLVAYVVGSYEDSPALDRASDPQENRFRQQLVVTLREYLGARLPDHMIPLSWMVLRQLPLTPSGKLDRRALPAPRNRRAEVNEYVAPRTDTERSLVDIWIQVLKVDGIGVLDSFLELGGHSLHAMTLIARIAEKLRADISVIDVLQSLTVEQLAKLIESRKLLAMDPADTNEPEYEDGVI